ncbi:hypothetical protein OK016_26900 [Vibrio chagasii]|nr:hypothetical protein [Vibrio chagasii]
MLARQWLSGTSNVKRFLKEHRFIDRPGVTAILGITEPALFGVPTKYTKAMMTASFWLAGVRCYLGNNRYALNKLHSSSVFSFLPAYLASGTQNFLQAIMGVVGVFALSFVLTMLFVKLDNK